MLNIDIDGFRNSAMPVSGNTRGVYLLFDNDELVYIGQSWNCKLRVAEHTGQKSDKKFTSWNYIPVDEEAESKRLERILIQEHKPKYNTHFK